MAQSLQTPGVYVIEQNAFPNSVVPVATAIPAFIGYSQQTVSAASQGQDMTLIPTQITSLKQFEDFFGTGYTQTFTATVTTATATVLTGTLPTAPTNGSSLPAFPTTKFSSGAVYTLTPGASTSVSTDLFYLYSAIQLFYKNGGSTCYIVSLGNYAAGIAGPTSPQTNTGIYQNAIATLELEPDPTMLLCPDALMYDIGDYSTVMQLMLAHCNKMQSRVAIFDVYAGAGASLTPGTDPSTVAGSPIDNFRSDIAQNYLNYGIAYFPWVNTNLFSASDITFLNIDAKTLTALATLNPAPVAPATTPVQIMVPEWGAPIVAPATQPPPIEIFKEAGNLQAYENGTPLPTDITDATGATLTPAQVELQLQARITAVNNALNTSFPDYALLTAAITNYLNTQPVAPAMAGIFTMVDNNVGVWKAPANVSLTAVTSPTVGLNDFLQADMNVDAATGKSVNAIRTFRGLGTLVWGARTLAGNSQDWRYINVRRTMIFIEQSVKLAARSYVFAPNDANTWTTVKSMISSFLFNIWKQGALAGAVPADAYSVAVGLGTTMTDQDILDGYMNVFVKVAISRPAEFIVLNFQQQMQKS